MTTPHPTPEERVEAALNDWRKDAGDLRSAILAMQAERRGAKQDIVDLAKDLVALWTSPKISGLPRSERNAAIEDTRNAMIEAVGNLARSSVGSEQGSSNSEVTGSSPVAPATNAAVAQSAEQPFCKGTVSGSSPDGGTNTQPAPIAGLEPVASLLDELREYTALRYAGDCKCGNCQLVPRAAAMSQPSRSTMTERRFARIAFWNGRKVMRMTTNPHPTPEEGMTPEERYEALCRVFEHTGHALAGFQADAVMKSIREAEAAGEARGRAMERERIKDALDFRLIECEDDND